MGDGDREEWETKVLEKKSSQTKYMVQPHGVQFA